MPPGAYQAEPPEVTSAGFWLGPGAGTFFASATQLQTLVAQIVAMLGGHMAVEGAMGVSWPSISGELARLAHTPHMTWLATLATMVGEASIAIEATGAAFETAKAATPTPAEVGLNQSEHVALNLANFMGFLTPLITANRADYGRMWVQGVTNKYGYAAASAAGVQAIPPVPPPPPSTVGAPGGGMPLGQSDPTEALAAGNPMDMMGSILPMIGQLPSSLMQGGGPLKSIGELPQQVFGQLSSLASSVDLAGGSELMGADLGAGNWVTAPPVGGGPVSASLGAGGGGLGAGGGTMSAASALRSPGSWSSAVNAAGPMSAEGGSRIETARAAATTVPAGGGGGGMMAPMGHGAAGAGGQNNEGDKKQQGVEPGQVLTEAASLFREPDGVPVITGGGGVHTSHPAGKEAP
ncbi:MAG: PPE family protein [Actinomycetia bacterium]|nr:PPE family protein [Actinomycetes bacterium]